MEIQKNNPETLLSQVGYEEKKEPLPEKFRSAMNLFTDKMALAEQFIEKQPLCFDKAGLFWVWDFESRSWKKVDETDVLNSIHSSFGADIITSKQRTEILNALKQVGRRKQPKQTPSSWIQFRNGIIDLKQPGVLLEPSPEYFSVNPVPWSIGNNDQTPLIDGIFKEWVGKDYVRTLHEVIAYCLIPAYPLQRIFCLLGDGRNGKSKFLELIRKFVGDENVCSTELDTLLSSRFEVTRLYKKLVCQMGETNFNELSRTSIIKKLTGGDFIGFEFKNKTPFEDVNYAKIIIATNNLPATSDKTDGFYRRWLLIDFPNKFTEKKDILAGIPDQEFENLAFKCVMILNDLQEKREFTNEGSYEERQKRYEERSNPFDKFFNEFVEEDADQYITKHQFSIKLSQWCQENRHREISDVSVNKRMREKGIYESVDRIDWWENDNPTKKQVRVWKGIGWKSVTGVTGVTTNSTQSTHMRTDKRTLSQSSQSSQQGEDHADK